MLVHRCGAVLGLLVLSACSQPAVQPPRPSPRAVSEALEVNAAAQTALLTVELHPDGSAQLTGLAIKPFPFRRHHLTGKPQAQGGLRLEVSQGSSAPLVVPLDLGAPGEGGGDVRDRWAGGTVILRAPYLGGETRFALVRDTPKGSLLVSTWGAR